MIDGPKVSIKDKDNSMRQQEASVLRSSKGTNISASEATTNELIPALTLVGVEAGDRKISKQVSWTTVCRRGGPNESSFFRNNPGN